MFGIRMMRINGFQTKGVIDMGESIVLFESQDKEVRLDVGFDGETVWLTQDQMATLFSTSKQNISLHVNNCFREGELVKGSVVKESLTTAADGKNYRTNHYNLDVIISVGYRVKSQRGVEFRRWATNVLRRYIRETFGAAGPGCSHYGAHFRRLGDAPGARHRPKLHHRA